MSFILKKEIGGRRLGWEADSDCIRKACDSGSPAGTAGLCSTLSPRCLGAPLPRPQVLCASQGDGGRRARNIG